MSVAYILLAHRHPEQVERLFRRIWHADDTFVLHFDRRAPAALHALGRRLAASHANVILQRSRAVLWGGAIMSEVQIAGMDAALRSGRDWTHALTLTGQDYPLRPRATVLARLDPAHSYLSWFDPLVTPLWKNARERLTRYHLHWPWLHRLLSVPGLGRRLRDLFGWRNQLPYLPGYRRSWPDFFHYYGGANHVALTRPHVEYLTGHPAALRLRHWLLPVGHADEIVFASALLNSPFAAALVNDHLRAIEFPDPSSPNPRTWGLADLPRLLAARDAGALFARKFDLAADPAVLDALDATF
jgi:hypothetical protein